jgi:2-keto-4-pentenoate hydratase/2-oxohepta-3-ene-1,7-dioic acid hydratase in catechol pathway
MGICIGRCEWQGTILWGVVQESTLFPLSAAYPTLRALLNATDLAAQLEVAVDARSGLNPGAIRWLSPVTRDAQVRCQGVNYAGHRQEGGLPPEKPAFNTIFTKASSAICGPSDNVIRPPHVRLLDYEVELGIVIGKEITGPVTITAENLHEYVAGIVITDDVSARDVQIPQGQWTKGKSYRTFCPVGPYLYLLDDDEAAEIDNLELNLWVNGELRQSANTSQMLYRPAETLTELSGVMDLFPGDLLMTGTPSGVALNLSGLDQGAELQTQTFVEHQLRIPKYLQDGDVIRVAICSPSGEIDLGVQENRVVKASA